MKKYVLFLFLVVLVCGAGIDVYAQTLSGSTGCTGSALTVTSGEQPSQIVWQLGGVGISTVTATIGSDATTVAGQSDGTPGIGASQLTYPTGVYVDGSGNVYVADQNNNRIQEWAPGATSGTTVAGQSDGDYGNGVSQLYEPTGVYVDGSGNIYVADHNNNRIQKWAPGTTAGTTVAGGNGFGIGATQLAYPVGVYVDGSGNIYVVDSYNNRIQEWASGATSGTTVAGQSNGLSGSDATQLASPTGVYVDGSGNIYVADYGNNRIQEWTPGATSGTTVAGTGTAGSSATQLNAPYGVYVDGSGNIYVADGGNNRIQKWALGATSGTTVAGQSDGTGGIGANQLQDPSGVYVDGSGNIYVADAGNNRIQEFTASITNTLTATSAGIYNAVVTTAAGSATTNTVMVNVAPDAGTITGTTTVCAGTTTNLADAAIGGAWSSSAPGIGSVNTSGTVTGISQGITTISYTVANSCGTVNATTTVTVNPLPSAISGSTPLCAFSSITLTDDVGGTWSSSATVVATIGSSSGVVTGVGTGTTHITYTSDLGCKATTIVTVAASPSVIFGATMACTGALTSLSNSVAGGTWSSSDNSVATIGFGDGSLIGVVPGTATVSYFVSSGCGVSEVITVNQSPAAIIGATSVCIGATMTLSDSLTGGTWSSSSPAYAPIGSASGIVSGHIVGDAVISYTLNGCKATSAITVNPVPVGMTGTKSVCAGSLTVLGDGTVDGVWSSSASDIATVGSGNGYVIGVAPGTDMIAYTLATGCYVAVTVTVNPLPSSISGIDSVCAGTTTNLSDPTTGGTWASSNTAVCTVGPSGIATGITQGTSVITYKIPTGCISTITITVNAVPAPITGLASVCAGLTTALSDTSGGGVWIGAGDVSISAEGVVTGISAGTATVVYVFPATGCVASKVVTVNPLPSVIDGIGTVCTGLHTSLSDSLTGGTWSSSDITIASISGTGVVTGVAPGIATITYRLATGCINTTTVTVNETPGAITGIAGICPGSGATLSDTAVGGAWSSSATAVATIDGSGNVTALAAGTAMITYTLVAGCIATDIVTVHPVPSVITGTGIACTASTVALSDASTGGAWSSGNTAVATIAATGVVTGISAGTTTISYSFSTGCLYDTTITINATPSAITGTLAVCNGATTTLDDATSGGTWSSGATLIATVDLGAVTGIATGTARISYTLITGCNVTAIVTVDPLPAAITGETDICQGTTATLADATAGGTWSSNDVAFATISATGVMTGAGAGTTSVNYTLSTGCMRTASVIVNPAPPAITGVMGICSGATTMLSDITGGTWSSSVPGVAAIGSVNGVVTGVAAGTATIAYTYSTTGCKATTLFTVNPVPAAISGSTSVCTGAFITFTDAVSGGAWSSSNTLVGTVGGGSGIVLGVAAGVDTITYALSDGCSIAKTVTVNVSPSAIAGVNYVCAGLTTTLNNTVAGGTWTSSITTIASVGSASGIVSGNAAGVTNITYTLAGGCKATTSVTVNPLPSPITGTLSACVGLTSTLSDATILGTWSSSNTAAATIGSSGIVTGITASAAIITYTLPTGCLRMATFVVNPTPSVITGNGDVCIGSTFVLSNSLSSGVWSSNAPAIATIGVSNGLVTGISGGNAAITYKMSTGCLATTIVTIDPSPGPITGVSGVCAGSSIALGATAGGQWSSGNLSVASVDISGVVTGVSAGTAIISYTLATSCFSTAVVTVNAYPGGINGIPTVCQSSATSLSDATTGGTWSSSSPGIAFISATGIVSGETPGAATITYTPHTGCYVTTGVVVNPLPAAITGAAAICTGYTITLSDTSTGGTWSSSGSSATINSASGVVTGISAGTPIITYILPTGCKTTTEVTVNSLPVAITGALGICNGATATLADATPGGNWTSSDTFVAQIGIGSGNVEGIAPGTATITYTMGTGCIKTATVTINPSPGAITGSAAICVGATVALSDTALGGVWSYVGGTIVSIGSGTGMVSGLSAGAATITYSLAAGCKSLAVVTVNPVPAGITGTKSVCAGATTALTDVTSFGTWSSSNSAVAVLDLTTGVVSGMSAGTATATYTLVAGCYITTTVTVNPSPAAISGNAAVCAGFTSALTNAVTGGTWSSSHTAIATVGTSSGVVSGIAAGTATITYSLAAGCKATVSFVVNPVPSAITGTANVCTGAYTDFSDAVAGGIWTSSNTAIASIGSVSGVILGNESGTSAITYTLGSGCLKAEVVTVNQTPASIAGTVIYCAGAASNLSDAITGGHWSSSNTTVATIGSATALLTSIASGTAIITYKLATGCMANTIITVNPLPAAITGVASACAGNTLFLGDATAGGIWQSSNNGIATIDGAGNVVTFEAGKDTITYSLATGCDTKITLTVNPVPVAITGALSVCTGSTITMSDATASGTWSASNTTIATVGTGTGVVTGVAAGVVTISYKLVAGCSATTLVTVNQTPSPILGAMELCLSTITTLTDTVAGGMWTSGAPAIAPIGLYSGITSGVSPGMAAITYMLATGCMVTTIVTVDQLPNAGTISGPSLVCMTSVITLSDSTVAGVWSSSAPDTASINSSGVVTGVAVGNVTISYTVTQFCGTVVATKNIVVNPLPFASDITGNTAACINGTTVLADSIAGGIWHTVDTTFATINDSGIVTGISAGIATIMYSVTNVCGTNVASVIVTIDPFASRDSIYTHPNPYMCSNTDYQNFGVGAAAPSGVMYTWAAYNADIVSVSPNHQNTLISFPTEGTAYVILGAEVINTGCSINDTFVATISNSVSRLDTVEYYTSQLVCTDNTADSYQWGYDDAVNLDSTLIFGATFQDYYLPYPQFDTRSYWVITTHNGCMQKTYYNAPGAGQITGVQQVAANKTQIVLYPNPANATINIEVKNQGSADDITVQLYDMLGNNIKEGLLVAGKGSMDITGIASGVYSVRLVQNGAKLGAVTFVKN